MKTKLLRFWLTALMLLVTTASYAYDVCIDGIYYNLNQDRTKAFVTYRDKTFDGSYSGDVVIPSTISYDGKQIIVEAIASYAFSGSKKLNSVIIPEGVTCIENNAFNECTLLSRVNIPDAVTKIETSTFRKCTNLTHLTLPKNLKCIEGNSFCWAGLTSMNIPEGTETIGKSAFFECRSLKEVILPSTLKEIGSGAFAGCAELEEITIPQMVKSIESTTFSCCYSLSRVSLPLGLEEINESAFSLCWELNHVCIPSSVQYIGSKVFNSCNKLTEITSLGTEPPAIVADAFDNSTYSKATLNVPETNDAVSKYRNSNTWGKFQNIVAIDLSAISAPRYDSRPTEIFTIEGRRVNSVQNGVNIIRTEDGKTVKVLKM